jgi:hypothetical protein
MEGKCFSWLIARTIILVLTAVLATPASIAKPTTSLVLVKIVAPKKVVMF